MSTHRSCCCEEPLKEVYGFMMQTIRWKRPEDILVQTPTRNFYMFHEIGAKGICYAANQIFGISGTELVSIEQTDEFDDFGREQDEKTCQDFPVSCGSLGPDYYGDYAHIRGGTWYALNNVSGISGSISGFTGPVYLGTYRDAFIPGITGGLVDSVLGSTYAEKYISPIEEEKEQETYTIFYEYDLFLPEELRNANIASIKGEYDYFDRFCQNDTGQCFGDTLSGLTGWRIFKNGYETNPNRAPYWNNSGRNYVLPPAENYCKKGEDVLIGSNTDERTYIPVITEFYTTITNHKGDKSYCPVSGKEYKHEDLGANFAYKNILKKSNIGFTLEYWNPIEDQDFPADADNRVRYFTFKNTPLKYSFYSRDDLYSPNLLVGNGLFNVFWSSRFGGTIQQNRYGGGNGFKVVRGVYTNTIFKYWDWFKTDWKFPCENGADFRCLKFTGFSSIAGCTETNPIIAGLGGISGATIGNWEFNISVKTKIKSKTKFNFSKGMSTISDLLTYNKPTKNTYGLTLNPRNPFTVGQNVDRSWFKNIKPLLDIYKNVTLPKQDAYSNYARSCGLPDPTKNETAWVARTQWPYTYPDRPRTFDQWRQYITEDATPKKMGSIGEYRASNGMYTDYCYYNTTIITNNNRHLFYTDFNACPYVSGFYYGHKGPVYEDAIREALLKPITLSVVRLTPIRYTDAATKTTKIKYFITAEYPYNYDVNGIWDGNNDRGPAWTPFVEYTRTDIDDPVQLCDDVKFLRDTNADCCDNCTRGTYRPGGSFEVKCRGGCDIGDGKWYCDEYVEYDFGENPFWKQFDPGYDGKARFSSDTLGKKTTLASAFSNWITTSLTGPTGPIGPNSNIKILFWGGEGKTENENTFSEEELKDIPTSLLKRWLFNWMNNPNNYCTNRLFGVTFNGIIPLLDNQEMELKLGYGFPNQNSSIAWRLNLKDRPHYVYTSKRTGNEWRSVGNPLVTIYEGGTVDPAYLLQYSQAGWPVIESKNYFGSGRDVILGNITPGPGICKPSIDGNNIWYGVKNYAKDVYKCGVLRDCEGFNTPAEYYPVKPPPPSPHPANSFFYAYPKGHTLMANMCKRLIEFFGVVTGPDDPNEKYVNLQSVFPIAPQKMNIGETYDWRMPLYASNDPDFQSVFWRYASGITKGYSLDNWSQYQL